MSGLEGVVERLVRAQVRGKLIVNGSFLTEKIDPSDVDIVLEFDAVQYDSGANEVREPVDWLSTNLKDSHRCDSYAYPVYPVGHPYHPETLKARAYWRGWFGFDRGDQPKGMVVVELT